MSANQDEENLNLNKADIAGMMSFIAQYTNQVLEIIDREEESCVFKGTELVINYHSDETQTEEISVANSFVAAKLLIERGINLSNFVLPPEIV